MESSHKSSIISLTNYPNRNNLFCHHPYFLYIRLMSDQTIYHLGIVIDHLTTSIRDTITGENFDTHVLEMTKADLKEVTKKNKWHFDWRREFKQLDRIVYKLIITHKPGEIQGLVSISDVSDHYYLHLAESAPINFGEHKRHDGVGGNLFAFSCKCSWDKGNEGIVAFKSKTKLIKHYEEALGAVHIGNHNMIIYPKEALILINKYFKK